MCLVSLTGCTALKSFEKDIQVVLNVNGEIGGVYTVNTFNNALVPVPVAPDGMSFLGWTGQENWEKLAAEDIVVSANNGLIRYDDVKGYVHGDDRSVTLYAAFAAVPPKDLVVAWYRAEGVSTNTGLDEESMEAFTEAMFTYLRTKGFTPEDMDIVVRAYDKNVGSSCGQIVTDGDIDIMVGWAGNINSTGGITFIENNDNISIGSVPRYAARLTGTYLSRLAYTWILNTYGGGKYNLPDPDPNDDGTPTDPEPGTDPEPETDPKPSALPVYTVDAGEKFSVKIAWYAKSETSGIEQSHIDALETALKADLEKMGFTLDNITVTTKGYDGKVGPSCEAVMADGDVDIMIGWAGNIGTTGGMEGKFLENVDGIMVGSVAGRYAAILTDSDFVKVVFAWIRNTYGTAVDYPASFGQGSSGVDSDPDHGSDPNPDTTEQAKLVIGWYSKTETSGLSEEIMINFKTALEKYLASQGYDAAKTELVIRPYDGAVADMGAAINKDSDVDVLIGVGNNINSTGGVSVVEKEGDIPMGGQTRYIALLTETDIAKLVYAWVKTESGYASLA